MKIMETLLLCGKQNIAIRGHTPERSNFMAILNSKAQGDPILTEHLANVNSRLMHIHRDFKVNLDKSMDVFVAAKKRRTDF